MGTKWSIFVSLLLFFGGTSIVSARETLVKEFAPIYLNAGDLSLATGEPSRQIMVSGSTHVPIWSLSGGTAGQSVAGVVSGLPDEATGVKVEIIVTTTDEQTSAQLEDVFRVHLSQMVPSESFSSRGVLGAPVRTPLPAAPLLTRTITLESYYEVDPRAPLVVRIQREPADPADTYVRPDGLALVKITPLRLDNPTKVVQDIGGYNSWPVIQALGDKLVCVYSRGTAHSIDEDVRAVYARTSTDGGQTWTKETVVANTPESGEVTIGKGLDSTGAMLLWVRRIGKEWNHDLYRTSDGVTFTHLSTPSLDPMPIQITDVFSVPTVGLMALWFAGNYNDNGPSHSWGTIISSDDGATWTQRVVESGLNKADWPTEQSAVYLGDGKLLAVARSELGDQTTDRSQFQMISTDSGATWRRFRTNITNVLASTPSLIYDTKTGLVSNYYYHRGRGVLRRRVVKAEDVFENPLAWPTDEPIAVGSAISYDAGNVNATIIGDTHYLAFYTGKDPDTSVVTAETVAPK